MDFIKKNQKISIIPDRIDKISTGIIISSGPDGFVAEVSNTSAISQGLEQEIVVSSENYTVTFTSKINKLDNNNVFFSIPSEFTFVQRREYPRININIPVFLTKTAEPEIKTETVNIGGGGIQVTSPINFDVKTILKARFNLSEKKEINTDFEVLRCEAGAKKEFTLSGKFNNISNFDKTTIIQFCFKRQLESACKR